MQRFPGSSEALRLTFNCLICDFSSVRKQRGTLVRDWVTSVKLVTSPHGCSLGSIPSWGVVWGPGEHKTLPQVLPHSDYREASPLPLHASDADTPSVKIQTVTAASCATEPQAARYPSSHDACWASLSGVRFHSRQRVSGRCVAQIASCLPFRLQAGRCLLITASDSTGQDH